MRGRSKAVLMGFVHDGPIDFGGHFLACATEIVDAHLYNVGLIANQFINALSRLLRSRDYDSPGDGGRILYRPGDIQSRHGSGGSFGARFPQSKFLVAAQTQDSSNAVAQVDPKLGFGIEMAVRVDQPGDNCLSRGVNAFRSGRNLDSFSYRLDVSTPNHESRVFDRRLPGAIDDACSNPGLDEMRDGGVIGTGCSCGKVECCKKKGPGCDGNGQGDFSCRRHVSSTSTIIRLYQSLSRCVPLFWRISQ